MRVAKNFSKIAVGLLSTYVLMFFFSSCAHYLNEKYTNLDQKLQAVLYVDHANLSWDAIEGAEKYNVYVMSNDNRKGFQKVLENVSGTSVDVSLEAPDTKIYWFKVGAVNTRGVETGRSEMVGGLCAISDLHTESNYRWYVNFSSNAEKYLLYYSVTDSFNDAKFLTMTTETRIDVGGYETGYFWVVGYNEKNELNGSNIKAVSNSLFHHK